MSDGSRISSAGTTERSAHTSAGARPQRPTTWRPMCSLSRGANETTSPTTYWLYAVASREVLHTLRASSRQGSLHARAAGHADAIVPDGTTDVDSRIADEGPVNRARGRLSGRDAEALRLGAARTERDRDGPRYLTGCCSRSAPDTPTGPMVQRDVLPQTTAVDPINAQALPPLDPAGGFFPLPSMMGRTGVSTRFTPTPSTPGQRRYQTAGRSASPAAWPRPPTFLPAVATSGRVGWVDYHELTDRARPQLTDDGLSQQPIPVYDQDGRTIIGSADVSRPIP